MTNKDLIYSEEGWLVEDLDSKPAQYWAVDSNGQSFWYTNAYKAVRFAREKDANDYIRLANFSKMKLKAVLHQFQPEGQ